MSESSQISRSSMLQFYIRLLTIISLDVTLNVLLNIRRYFLQDTMSRTSEDTLLINLNKHFNYKTLHPGQLSIIQQILKEKDVIVCKETNFGKSLCYQLSSTMRSGIVIVVSSSLTWIENECQQLATFNVKGAYLNSTATNNNVSNSKDLRSILNKKNKLLDDLKDVKSSGLKLVYVTLEYFTNSNRLRSILKEIYGKRLLQAIVIDQVQFVTPWSYSQKNFQYLGSIRDLYPKTQFVCILGPRTHKSIQMIQKTMRLKNPIILNEPSVKGNISFKVMYKGDNFSDTKLVQFVKTSYGNKSGIIYCNDREHCSKLSKELDDSHIRNFCYKSTLADDEKNWLKWINKYGVVIICESGSKMDLNLSKVDFVIHSFVPNNLDIYMQEAEKASKNIENGDCILFYGTSDHEINFTSASNAYRDKLKHANSENKKHLLTELKEYRNDIFDVVIYAENTSLCRQVFLLRYFNEENVGDPCGRCDVCDLMQDCFLIDVSAVLKKILIVLWAINRRQSSCVDKDDFFYASIEDVIKLLLGDTSRSYQDTWLVDEWFFGVFGSWDEPFLQRLIFVLLSNRYAAINHVMDEKFKVLQNLVITPKGQQFVKSNAEFNLPFSLKDITFCKWVNVEWIKFQFKRDLEGAAFHHFLHSNVQQVYDWYRTYIWELYQRVPSTWDDFKAIKVKYMQNKKSDFDEDLFTICVMYHQLFKKLSNNDGHQKSMDKSESQKVEHPAKIYVRDPRLLRR